MEISTIIEVITGASIGAGVVGAVFWKILEKGVNAKLEKQQIELTASLNRQTERYKFELNAELSRQLENDKAKLVVSSHRENTVFSRIDEQRADVVQKLGNMIGVFRMELMDFSPKYSITSKFPQDPAQEAVIWCINLMISTKDPLRTAFSHALLLPPKLPTEVWAWHAVVFEALRKLLEQLLQARTNESFDAMNGFPDAQRKLLEEVKNKWADVEQIHVTRANNTLENRLRELFESIDRPRLGEERLPLPSTPST